VRDRQVTYTLETPIWVLVTAPVPQMMEMPEGVGRPYFETLDEIKEFFIPRQLGIGFDPDQQKLL
jgi:hypothetical protein